MFTLKVEDGSRSYSSEGVDVTPGEGEHGVVSSEHDPAKDQVSGNVSCPSLLQSTRRNTGPNFKQP